MSFNLNSVSMAGRLTNDPELRTVGESAVAKFGLAVNRTWKNKSGEKQEEATFLDIEAWGKTGELVAQYLKKGSPCYLEGRLKMDKWQTKTGEARQSLKVVADSVQFLGTKPADGERAEPAMAAAGAASKPAAVVDTDEPPF